MLYRVYNSGSTCRWPFDFTYGVYTSIDKAKEALKYYKEKIIKDRKCLDDFLDFGDFVVTDYGDCECKISYDMAKKGTNKFVNMIEYIAINEVPDTEENREKYKYILE